MTEEKQCKNCKYYHPQKDSKFKYCSAYYMLLYFDRGSDCEKYEVI